MKNPNLLKFALIVVAMCQFVMAGCGSKGQTDNPADNNPAKASFNTSTQTIAEDIGSVNATLTLDKAVDSDITVNIALSGTATGGNVD